MMLLLLSNADSQSVFHWEVSGLQNPFCALKIPSWCLEKVKWTSQCSDFNMFSTSLITFDSSRTISLPPGLTILSTSAITGTRLHLSKQNKTRDLLLMKRYQKVWILWVTLIPCSQLWEKMICMSSLYWSTIYPVVTFILQICKMCIVLFAYCHQCTKRSKRHPNSIIIFFEWNLKLWIYKCRTMTNFRFLVLEILASIFMILSLLAFFSEY